MLSANGRTILTPTISCCARFLMSYACRRRQPRPCRCSRTRWRSSPSTPAPTASSPGATRFFSRMPGSMTQTALAAIRHARAAVSYGRDDATALALGAFTIAMVEHDRATAFAAFEQALALSPSSSFTLFLGCVASGLRWRGGACNRLGRACASAQPFRSAELCFLSRIGRRAFPAWPLRGGGECRASCRAIQSRLQRDPQPAGGAACQARTYGRSESSRPRAFWRCNRPSAQVDSAPPSRFPPNWPSR